MLLARAACAADPPVVYLWPEGAPGSEGKTAPESVRVAQPGGDHVVSSVHKPSLTLYLPSKATATGAGVIIMPGGGHSALWMDHEGYNEARWLSEHGVAGFVLKYRLAREKDSTYTIEGHALTDAQNFQIRQLGEEQSRASMREPARASVRPQVRQRRVLLPE